jgi:Zinc finger, C2H2 type
MYCDLCKFKTCLKNYIVKHMVNIHVPRQLVRYNCDKCSSSFTSQQAADYHEKKFHTNIPKTYKMEHCHICDKNFKSKFALKTHNALKHEPGNFECTKCDKKFVFKPHLENHILSEHSEKVTCHVCGVLSRPGIFFAAHMVSHRSKLCSFEGCNKMIGVRYMKKHIEVAHQPLHLQCPRCPSVFKTTANFRRHFQIQHKRDPLVCKVCGCGYKVQRKKYLGEHYMRHKGITEEERAYLIAHLKKIKPLSYNETKLGRRIMKSL